MKTVLRIKAALLCMCYLFLTGCKEELVRNLHDGEVRKIIGVLADAGIRSDRRRLSDNSWSIEVESNDVLRSMQLIEQYRLIEPKEPGDRESSLFSSDQEQRLRYQQGIARQIESTLKTLDGVLDAKVMMTLPQEELIFGRTSEKGSGSVLVIGSVDLMITTEEIQELVSGAAGLPTAAVHVLVKPGKFSPPPEPYADPSRQSPLRQCIAAAGAALCAAGAFLIIKRGGTKQGFCYEQGNKR